MKGFAKFLTKLFVLSFFRVKLINAGNIPDKGSAILCSTHNTMLDMLFLGYGIKRWIYWMAKEELFKNPIAGTILKSLGAFPVKRGKGDVGSIKTAYKLLADGNIVGIFPHGSRISIEKRKTAKIKTGAAMVAVNTGAVIIPATVVGSYKPFSTMKVIFGKPYSLEIDSTKKYSTEELNEISKGIMDRIYSLTEE